MLSTSYQSAYDLGVGCVAFRSMGNYRTIDYSYDAIPFATGIGTQPGGTVFEETQSQLGRTVFDWYNACWLRYITPACRDIFIWGFSFSNSNPPQCQMLLPTLNFPIAKRTMTGNPESVLETPSRTWLLRTFSGQVAFHW